MYFAVLICTLVRPEARHQQDFRFCPWARITAGHCLFSHLGGDVLCYVQVLQKRLQESGMPLEPYAAYLDIREYGTVPHAGFGLGFERLILFATGLENIREAIPFPRWPGHAEC